MTRATLHGWLLVAVVSTIGCDRVTKHVATTSLAGVSAHSYLADTLRLEYVENTGGFLGLGAEWPDAVRTTLFTAGTGIVLLGLAGFALRFRWRGERLIGVCFVFAGGASNWVDRVARGSVVDFMNVGVGPLRTGIFNVADVAIMVGVALLLLDVFRPGDSQSMRPAGTKEEHA
jgi:signal peptidase II